MGALNFYAPASSFSYILGSQLQLRLPSNEFKQPTMSRQARVCEYVCVADNKVSISWRDRITGLYCTLASVQSRRKTHKISCSCGEALNGMEIKLVSSTSECLQVCGTVCVCVWVVTGALSAAPSLSRHLSAFPCCQFNCNCNQCTRSAQEHKHEKRKEANGSVEGESAQSRVT